MEVPIGEVVQRFEEAKAAAERGEPILVTHDGRAIAELIPFRKPGFDFESARQASKKLGLDQYTEEELWPPEFDDPAYSRKVLGLE